MRDLLGHPPNLDLGVLIGTTPQGNTCLYIAATRGRKDFCQDVLTRVPSLLASQPSTRIAAVASGHVSVASFLLSRYNNNNNNNQSEGILKQDKRGCNVLHHAIRSGHTELALELIDQRPSLSHAVNQYGESPMNIAVMRNYSDVFDKLLEIADSAHGGAHGENALHAAVRNNNSGIAKAIMKKCPALAREVEKGGNTPMHLAALWNMTDVLKELLEHDRSLGFVYSSMGIPLLVSAALRGHVDVAQVLLKYCPDAPLLDPADGWTCLHQAVLKGRTKFVDFVLDLPQFGRLVNMRDGNGETALHHAVRKSNLKMVAALLRHRDIDVTVLNNDGISAIWRLANATEYSKTLNWNEVSMLMLKADPQAKTDIYNLRRAALDELTESSRKGIKSLTKTYTSNTSLVAILIATITFAAAFTLPGGYSTDTNDKGLPILIKKFAFKAFLISDTLAMCSSLAVAFICVIAKLDDLEFLVHYRYFTQWLMWFAYIATTTAFATGLYTVLAPRLLWLAIAVCVLTTLLPILTFLLGKWPILILKLKFNHWRSILRLKFRLGPTFLPELLDDVMMV